ncbi:MAG: hypothetical protein NZ934_00305 [Hadesarchaea archaeon]|nr:hypothetical protein [Hadesarchaea archaeon]
MQDPKYLCLIKNLRGVLYRSEGVKATRELEWLRRKFKYRWLAVSGGLRLDIEWKNLVVVPKLRDDPAVDSLFQASKFVCPLIVLKERSLKDFKKAVVSELKTEQELADGDIKFNLRLVDYAITDFYVKSIELGKSGKLAERAELAQRDLKRFWRIKPGAKGRTVVAYIDPLLLERPEEETLMSLIPCFVLDLGKRRV